MPEILGLGTMPGIC